MKIAILITCNDTSEFAKRHPDDGEKFRALLSPIRPHWEYRPVRVTDGELPERVDDHDGYIVCGSSASVQDEQGWVIRLLEFIRDVDSRNIPLFGCCFGHQAIAKALGGEVALNRFGWSAGIETTEFVRNEDWMPPEQRSIDLYSFHEEQVSELPAGCRVVGTGPSCPVAAFARGRHVFTTQYHPEMTADYALDLVNDMTAELGSKQAECRSQLEKGAQGDEFAQLLVKFLEFAHSARISQQQQSPDPIQDRHEAAIDIARLAGDLTMGYFGEVSKLHIESKGPGDLVSEADRNAEHLIRSEISKRFPDDGIIGEEFDRKPDSSGFTWVIDPIDGTANFVRGIPVWCISIACVRGPHTVIGVINDPVHDEMYDCRRNHGTRLNGTIQHVSQGVDLSEGYSGVGFSPKFRNETTSALIGRLLDERIIFSRSGSGALGLAYVASGRFSAFIEEHMNAWDCLAGLLLVEEAGGIVLDHDAERLIERGGKIVASGPFAYGSLRRIADEVFDAESGIPPG